MVKRNPLIALALCLGLGLGSAALTQDRELADRDADRIAALVRQLGSAKFIERERAKKELEGIGTPALEALKKAAKDENLETSKRAEELVRRIEDRILTAEMLNPKRVRLNVKDQPAMEVVAELSRLSGYNIQVIGDRAALAAKKITLDTGDVTFWEALDRLCEVAGLNERTVGVPTLPPGIRVLGGRGRIRIQPLPAPVPPRAAPGGVLPAPPPAPPPPPPPPEAPPVKEERPDEDSAVVFFGDEPAEQPVEKVEPKKVKAGKAKIVAPRVIAVPRGPVQIVPPPVPGGVAPGFPGVGPGGVAGVGQIQLKPGTHKSVPTSYAGSVRVRALSGKNLPAGTVKRSNWTVVLEAQGEPRLQGFQLVGSPTIHKAIDDLGQELTVSMEAPKAEVPMDGRGNIMIFPAGGMMPGMHGPMARQQTVVFNKGEKPGKRIKELKGTITAQANVPNEALVKVDNVMAAAGKTTKGASGGSITVDSVQKSDDGTVRMKVRMENLRPNPFGRLGGGAIMINGAVQVIQVGPGGAVIGGAPAQRGMPDLLDAKGNKYQLAGVPSTRTGVNGGMVTQEATLVYRATPGAGEPASLALYGERPVNFQVPFTFRDVPLE